MATGAILQKNTLKYKSSNGQRDFVQSYTLRQAKLYL